MKRVLLSWSSGKDSAWTLHELRRDPTCEVTALLTTVNVEAVRVAMHGVRLDLAHAQAEAAGLPLRVVPLPFPCSNDVYEARMGEAVRQALNDGFTHVAFGDLFLEDVRAYREERLAGTGLAPLFPLWGRPTGALAREMIAAGLDARVVCLDPAKIPRSLAARRFDAALLDDLPPGVDPCGERGEFHTFACGGPMFAQAIPVRAGEVVEREGFVFADLVADQPWASIPNASSV